MLEVRILAANLGDLAVQVGVLRSIFGVFLLQEFEHPARLVEDALIDHDAPLWCFHQYRRGRAGSDTAERIGCWRVSGLR